MGGRAVLLGIMNTMDRESESLRAHTTEYRQHNDRQERTWVCAADGQERPIGFDRPSRPTIPAPHEPSTLPHVPMAQLLEQVWRLGEQDARLVLEMLQRRGIR